MCSLVNWHAKKWAVIGWNLHVCLHVWHHHHREQNHQVREYFGDQVFSPPNKYCRIGMLDIFAFVGFTLGMLFSAIIFKYSGYFGVFGTTLGIIHFCQAFLLILVLTWSKYHPTMSKTIEQNLSSVCFWEGFNYWSSSTSFYLYMKLKGLTERKVKSSWETLVGRR